MKPIEFEFINKEVKFIHPTIKYKGNGLPMVITLPFRFGDIRLNESKEEAIERICNDAFRKGSYLVTKSWTDLGEIEFKKCAIIIDHPKPKEYPKFSNEKQFTAFNGKYINPEILNIRWHGPTQTWEYRLRNVGHVYDYIEEKYLELI